MNDFFKKKKIIILVIPIILSILTLSTLTFISLNYLSKNKATLERKLNYLEPKLKHENVSINAKPKFYLILDDVGYDKEMLNKFKNLKLKINYAIIPYLKNSIYAYNTLIAENKIVMIHFPMQAKSKLEIEKFNISMSDSKESIEKKINKVFTDYPKAKIMNNHMGSLITSNKDIMRIILKTLTSKNKYFFDSVTTANIASKSLSKELNIKVEKRDIFLDDVDSELAVNESIEKAKGISRKKGFVRVIGHVWSKNTLKVLKEHEKELNRDFDFRELIDLYGDNKNESTRH